MDSQEDYPGTAPTTLRLPLLTQRDVVVPSRSSSSSPSPVCSFLLPRMIAPKVLTRLATLCSKTGALRAPQASASSSLSRAPARSTHSENCTSICVECTTTVYKSTTRTNSPVLPPRPPLRPPRQTLERPAPPTPRQAAQTLPHRNSSAQPLPPTLPPRPRSLDRQGCAPPIEGGRWTCRTPAAAGAEEVSRRGVAKDWGRRRPLGSS